MRRRCFAVRCRRMWSLLTPLSSPFLAAGGLSDTPEALYLLYAGLAMMGLLFVVKLIDGITSIIDRFRSKPAADVKFATKEELVAVHARVDGISKEVTQAVEDLREAIQTEMREQKRETNELHIHLTAIHRSLGQLEGRAKA